MLAAKCFGTSVSLAVEELNSKSMLDTAVESSGTIFISTELGGGGFVSQDTLIIAENRIHLLHHLEIIIQDEEPVPETRIMQTPNFR